jgi:glycosyltransferase involved in cell wall biosynthesis
VPSPNSLSIRCQPNGEWIIGTVALFRPRKGIEVLLHALKELQNESIPFQLLAVGAFETTVYENKIKKLSKQLGIDKRIHWTGFVKNVTDYFAKMDIFVLPSLYGEGLPMVILEAMAAGVPVISTQVEGATEVIENGKTGLLIEPSSSSDLAVAIQKMITAVVCWSSMRAKAYAIQRAHFSSHSMTKGVADIYNEILS